MSNRPTFGVGCNNLGSFVDGTAAKEVVDAAFELGVAYFDTAAVYPPDDPGASESILGSLLHGRRDDAVIATKFGWHTAQSEGRADSSCIRASLESSLRRLRTDRIDLYQLHRPTATPIGETLEALVPHLNSGKVRQIGCSGFSAGQIRDAHAVAVELGLPMFATDSVELSVLVPQHELQATCARLGISMVPYFVLASGLLTGKYRCGAPPPKGTRLTPSGTDPIRRRFANLFPIPDYLGVIEALHRYGSERGHSLPELAIGWVASRPCVSTVLVGATSSAQLRANVRAFSAWRMSDTETAEIDELVRRSHHGSKGTHDEGST